MSSNIAEILNRTADLIEPEGAWTRGWFARDAQGRPVDVLSVEAVSWCAAGAILRTGLEAFEAFGDEFGSMPSCGLQNWNDAAGRTQSEVVSKLREAASKAREEGSV